MFALSGNAFPIIQNVVETGGDNEATDTVTAKWTGVTFNNGISGEFATDYTVPLFNEDVPCFVDRNHQWNGATIDLPLPGYLVGGEYIMIGNDNRDNDSLRLDVTVVEPVNVYLLIDNRLTDGDASNPPEGGADVSAWTGMAWVGANGFAPVKTGWNRTGDVNLPDEVGYDEGADGTGPGGDIDNYASVYTKKFESGTFSLYQPNNSGRNMYGVVLSSATKTTNTPPEIQKLTPTNNAAFYLASRGVSFTAATVGPNQINASNIAVVLNGVDISSSLTLGGSATARTVSYNQLVADTPYTAHIVVSDQAGRATTNNLTFDTFVASTAVIIDAEDYNYYAGGFSDPTYPGQFANQIGTPEIDYFDLGTTLSIEYRFNDLVTLSAAPDIKRESFLQVGMTDYQVTSVLAGEWMNYTRTFTSKSYQVFLRASSSVNQLVQLDRVGGDRTTTAQTPVPLGVFAVAGGGGFAFVPLTDAAGNPVDVTLSGITTLRLTALSANQNLQLNYFILVPAAGAAQSPYLSMATPGYGAVNVSPGARLSLQIANGGSPSAPTVTALVFDGLDVTSAASVTPTSEGLSVTYTPTNALATNTTYTVMLAYRDAASASYTNEWSFTTVAFIPSIPVAYSSPIGSGQNSGFNIKMRKAPDSNLMGAFTLANSTQRAEQQLADQLIDPETSQPFINQAGGPNGNGLDTRTLINFEQTGTVTGFFTNDTTFPYIDPLTYPDPNNIAMEATAYLELTAGIYRFGVRSDDGFRVTCGPVFSDTNLVLGIFDGGRGNGLPGGATEFDFRVDTDGIYPFRLIWYEGDGGASVEFYSVNLTTLVRTLINDTSQTGAIKAYLSRNTQVYVPTVAITSPANGVIIPQAPSDITLKADASVTNGTISKVEFFYDTTNKIGETTSAPYEVVWSQAKRGAYSLTAKATDTRGFSTVSAPISVRVGTPYISNVVETGGDNEATDTVPAKWTGVTFVNGISGEFPNPYLVPYFGEDVPTYVDRTHQWNGILTNMPLPSYLVGGEYIMSGNDNRDNATYQLDITLSEECYVYMLVDNRLGDASNDNPPNYPDWQADRSGDGLPDMAWLLEQGWKPMTNGLNRTANPAWPDEVGVDEGGDGVGPGGSIQNGSSVYMKRLPAGTFSIYAPDNTGQNMYGVVVKSVKDSAVAAKFAPPRREGDHVIITWTGDGRLQEAAAVNGPWTNVAGNPQHTYAAPINAPQMFFRVVAP